MIPMPVIALPSLVEPAATPDLIDQWIPADLTTALTNIINVQVSTGDDPVPFVDHADNLRASAVQGWDSYVGQEPLKRTMWTYMADADQRMATLPNTLLATGMAGAGKTTLARLIAAEMETRIRIIAPPFTVETVIEAMQRMNDWEILFIDEIHAMDKKTQDAILTAMEEGMLYLNGRAIRLADFTFIGATTDKDKLGEAVESRFAIRPATGAAFVPYTDDDCFKIAQNFAAPHNLDVTLPDDTLRTIARASQATPRVVRDMVTAGRALLNTEGVCTGKMVLDFLGVEPDGLTRDHKSYLCALYQFGGRKDGDDAIKYVMGQKNLETLLRLPSAGVLRLERFIIEKGLITKEASGRRLTNRGIIRAREFVARGEGHDVH